MDCDCTEGCQLADRFTPATRELLVFTKSAKRFFDLDSVREPHTNPRELERVYNNKRNVAPGDSRGDEHGVYIVGDRRSNPIGSPPLDWWKIDPDNPSPIPQAKEGQMPATFYIGDAIETMNKLPAGSVDLILTSPPFLALRSYLPGDHPDKAKEGGSQSTPGEFIDWLIDFAEASARVLAPHGSFCVELGDTYAGGGSGPPSDFNPGGVREGQDKFEGTDYTAHQDTKYPKVTRSDYPGGITNLHGKVQGGGTGWPMSKSLSLIPELFRLSLVYGFNPLTGRTTDRWRLRNVVRWVRPNPPVGALGDKFRPATSELMVFCKSAKRYFDLDAVREPYAAGTVQNSLKPSYQGGHNNGQKANEGNSAENLRLPAWNLTKGGAPPLDWWEIPPGGYEGSHYAVFPLELCVRPVKAMSPERVCKVCGEPSRRMVGETEYVNSKTGKPATTLHFNTGERQRDGENHWNTAGLGDKYAVAVAPTLGWTDCGHDDWRPGLILDPFGGSGTVAAVATGHGRDCILIDLDERNFDLALGRVGPFMLTLGNIDE